MRNVALIDASQDIRGQVQLLALHYCIPQKLCMGADERIADNGDLQVEWYCGAG